MAGSSRRPLSYLSRGEFGDRVARACGERGRTPPRPGQTAWCNLGIDVPSASCICTTLPASTSLGCPGIRELPLGGSASRPPSSRAAQRHRSSIANSARRRAANCAGRRRDADVTVVPLVLDPEHYELSLDGGDPVVGFIGTGGWPMTAAPRTDSWTGSGRSFAARCRMRGFAWPVAHGQARPPGRRRRGDPGRSAFGRRVHARRLGLVVSAGGRQRHEGQGARGARFWGTRRHECDRGGGDRRNEGVVVVEDDEALARAAVSILRDPEERRQRGAAGLQAFRDGHTPQAAAGMLFELYSRMADSG